MASLAILYPWLGPDQFDVLKRACTGEEGAFFIEKAAELAAAVTDLPATYSQEDLGEQAVVGLHYFTGGANWFIIERDQEPGQNQTFGLADLFGDGGELGYISIPELLENGAEMDFNWTQKTLAEVRARKN